MASGSSSASLSTHQYNYKHDVFLSFRGEDTRYGFVSHLHSALHRKSIRTFIDGELRRGEEISQALLNAIEGSMFAVVVFSKNYASSRWCLDELAKIVECMDTRGQKVIPVFYHIDPSDVRKQTGSFAEAFARHDHNLESNLQKVQRWRDALTKAASLSGWATQDCRSESAIVDGIIDCIWKDLQKMQPSPLTGLVGIGPRIEYLQTLLCGGSSNNVFILGLWGMGGVGKTTIARSLFDRIQFQFERRFFVESIREESEKRGLQNFRERLLSSDLGIYTLRDIKVLVVLDDVDNMRQLGYLLGDRSWCGPGSVIIITSRDMQLLKNAAADAIYQVKELADPDSLQLFCLHAFKHPNVPTDDLGHLSVVVAGYAKGVPLALKVLGSSLFDKGKRYWEDTLIKLEKGSFKEIQDVLRISYDGLDKEQQEIFLWIACLLNFWQKDILIEFLKSFFSTEHGLEVLVDKALITISDTNTIEMHDLLVEMAREIVRKESEDPSERGWLENPEDICKVLRQNSGTKKIKSILLKTSQEKEVKLRPDTFARMRNLKYLYIEHSTFGCSLTDRWLLPKAISGLPDELRILHWEKYPWEFLPANFNPENLIELSLPRSNVIEVFCEENQDLGKLRKIDLRFSEQLYKIPNLSRAPNVTVLNLEGCEKLRSIPDLSGLKSLRELILSGCPNLITFPKVPQSIEYLDLSGTAIKEVPSASLQGLGNLAKLLMRDCTQLESLPDNVDLKSLEKVDLSGCSSLKKFPEISKNLQDLLLDETAITEVPSSVVCLSRLGHLSMRRCTELRILPSTLWKLQSLEDLDLDCCSNLTEFARTIEEEEQQEENCFLGRLKRLSLSNCNLAKLPADLGRLHSFTILDLRGNSFKTIPASIKQLSQLWIIDICDCKSLQSLPELPPNLKQILAYGCTSLKTMPAALTCLVFESKNFGHLFNFVDCLKLDHMGWRDLAHAVMRNPHLANAIRSDYLSKEEDEENSSVTIKYTGSRIPGWFTHRSVGDSISFQLRSNLLNEGFLGFALGVVYKPRLWRFLSALHHVSYVDRKFRYEFHIGDKRFSNFLCSSKGNNSYGPIAERIILKFGHQLRDEVLKNAHASQSRRGVVLFKFHFFGDSFGKITECGVSPLYAQGGHNTMPLLPLGGPAESAFDKKSCLEDRCPQLDADELGGNDSASISGVDEEPPRPKRLKQTEGVL